MTDRYVDPSVGSSGAGTSWGTAYKTLKEATDAAAANDTIYFSNGTADVITVNTTYTVADGVTVISTAGATNTYAAGATISSTTFGVDIVIAGYGGFYGLTISAATSGTSTLIVAGADNNSMTFVDCILSVPSNGASTVTLGSVGSTINISLRTRRCKFRFGATGSSILLGCKWDSDGDVFADSGSVPTTLITTFERSTTDVRMNGPDLSAISGTLFTGNFSQAATFHLASPKLHASVTMLGTTVSLGSTDVFVYDGAYDNAGTLTGKYFYHENHAGSTTISTAIYANDGLTFDGTRRLSWVVDGKTTATLNNPYVSPWIDVYNDDIATAITPYLECVRDGSATAYTDQQVWIELAYRGTANSPAYTIVNDRSGIASSAANQTASSLAAGDWTGEGGTAWFGKLEAPASFTPAEVGHIRARVCVAGDNTVHVDPQVRGLA